MQDLKISLSKVRTCVSGTLFILLQGCDAGCPETEQIFVKVTNTFNTPVTLEMRFNKNAADPNKAPEYAYVTDIINANVTKDVLLDSTESTPPRKFGVIKGSCPKDINIPHYVTAVMFSVNTLSQYVVCQRYQFPESTQGFQILSMGTSCSNPGDYQPPSY